MPDQLGPLNDKELGKIIEVSHLFSECDDLDELILLALKEMEKFFRTPLNNYFFPCPQRRGLNLQRFTTIGLPTEYFEKFRTHYHKMDPFYRGPLYLPCPSIVTNEKLGADSSFLNGEYYNDFLKPQSIHHQMTIYLQNRDRFLGALSCFRPKSAHRFNDTEKTWAQVMARHLVQSIERNIVLEESKSWRTVLTSLNGNVFENILLILNDNLEAVYRNVRPLGRIGGQAEPKEAERLLDLIHQGVMARLGRRDQAAGGPPLGGMEDQACFKVDLPQKSLTIHTQRLKAPGGRTYLLLRTDDPLPTKEPADLRQTFKLSQREAEVVGELVKGLKNAEIAEKLYISPFTVENHLRSIFRKMKARNRAEVVHKALTGPPDQALNQPV